MKKHADLITYTALIADDEPVARDVIDLLLKEYPTIQVCARASDGVEALEMIHKYNPDVLFLDIHMPLMNGLKVAEKMNLSNPPYIVFTTAYDEYALQAFDLNALDYLLKPFDRKRFDESINRALFALEQREFADFKKRLLSFNTDYKKLTNPTQPQSVASTDTYLEKITIRDSRRIVFVKVENIIAIIASGDYVEICDDQNKRLLYKSLNEILKELDPKIFLRIHRSHIINIEKITEIRPHQNSEYFFHMSGGIVLKSSRSYKEVVLSLLSTK